MEFAQYRKLLRIKLLTIFILLSVTAFAQVTEMPLSRDDSAQIFTYNNLFEQFEKEGNLKESSRQLNSIALLYWQHNQNKNAVEYYLKSLELNKKLGNENGISMISNNLGLIYSDLEQYDLSAEAFQKTLAYQRTQPDKRNSLGSTLISIAVSLIKTKKFDEATRYVEESLKYAKDDNNLTGMRTCYGTLAEIYEKSGQKDKANDAFDKYRGINNLINEQNLSEFKKQQAIASQAEFEKLKKENELLVKEKELAEQTEKLEVNTEKLEKKEEENQELFKDLSEAEKIVKLKELQADFEKQKSRNMMIVFLSGALIFIIVISGIAYSLRLKKKANIELQKRNDEIIAQRNELDAANKDIVAQNEQIKAGINYAKLIQTAMLNRIDRLKDYLEDSFILFRPRDIVSGDFYWYAKTSEFTVVASVDCTGHGVPGAFLSMIGNQLLNKLVINEQISNPAEIITKMDQEIKLSLNQDHTKNSDGMDIAICMISTDRKLLKYAGARNPLVIVRNNEFNTINGNPYSIGGGYSGRFIKKFDEHIFEIDTPTSFFIYSDGYQDQADENNKKFGSKTFRNFLFEISSFDSVKQKEILKERFEKHKGKQKQVDDVLIIGVKI